MRIAVLGLAACLGLVAGAPKGDAELGLYQRHCARCHGADGSGKGPRGERLPGGRISEPARFADPGEDSLLALILDGRRAMPGFKAKIGAVEARKLARQVLKGIPKGR
jgi:mono/diheme cytochrome c family protein